MLPLLLDGFILILLAATVFFAGRLSLQLKAFRDNREQLRALIDDLAIQIGKAESSIAGLQENSRQSGRGLQELIDEAQALRDELQIMSESGDSLANRLERLAGQAQVASQAARQGAQRVNVQTAGEEEFTHHSADDAGALSAKTVKPATFPRHTPDKNKAGPSAKGGMGAFAIHDRDFDPEGGSKEEMAEDGTFPGEGDDDADAKNLHSQAERDLYEALRRG